jgi:hypothetical protein
MTFHSSISSPSFSDGNPLSSMIANGARAMSACCTSMGGRATCAFSGQFNAAIPSVTIAIAMLDWQEEDAPRKKASISFFRSFRSVRRDSRSTERLFFFLFVPLARIDIKGARCLLHDILLELRPDHTFLISARAACLHYTASPHAKRRNVCEVPAARGTAAHLLLGGHHDSHVGTDKCTAVIGDPTDACKKS